MWKVFISNAPGDSLPASLGGPARFWAVSIEIGTGAAGEESVGLDIPNTGSESSAIAQYTQRVARFRMRSLLIDTVPPLQHVEFRAILPIPHTYSKASRSLILQRSLQCGTSRLSWLEKKSQFHESSRGAVKIPTSVWYSSVVSCREVV